MLLSASDAPLISLPARQAVNIVIQPGYALVQWNPVTWSVSGRPKQPSNVLYTIYIWPSGNPSPAFNLAAPCGIDAFNAASPGVVYSVTDGVQKNISALDPAVTYTVAIKATCSAETCMFANLPSMSIAYIPATVQRLITASPTPAPAAPSNAKKSVAGPVIGWLIFTVVVLAGGYFGYRRWRAGGFAAWGLGGGSSSYSRFAMQPSSSSAQAGADDGTLYAKL